MYAQNLTVSVKKLGLDGGSAAAPIPSTVDTPTPKILDGFQGTTLSSNDITISQEIKEPSTFGQVFIAKWKNASFIVVKTVNKRNAADNEKYFLREANILAQLKSSPYIIGFYGAYDDNATGDPGLVLEFMAGGDLVALLNAKALKWPVRKLMGHDIVQAVAHLHKNGIVHRDIKPDNLLVDSAMRLKLCDFGLASDATKVEGFVGSPPFAAPENFEREEGMTAADFCAADMYSVAMTFFALTQRQVPPNPIIKTNKAFFQMTSAEQDNLLEQGDFCPPDAQFMKQIIRSCSQYARTQRSTAVQVLEIIKQNIPLPPPPASAPPLAIS